MKKEVKNEKDQIKSLEKQHKNNYQNAVIEIIKNNTNSLIDEDISSLVKKPPLDSMDIIKLKLLELAKKEKVVLDSEKVENMLFEYRANLLKDFQNLKNLRNSVLIEKVLEFSPKRETEIIKIINKDMERINKNINNEAKEFLKERVKTDLLINLDLIYKKGTTKEAEEIIKKNFSKYINNKYQKQLKENMAIKIMVKDRTLINGVIEQGERYLFTKSNSHIFDQEKVHTKK